MKLMIYNILEGGNQRLPLIIEVINSQSPDFLTINEANNFTTVLLSDFAKKTGFAYCEIVSADLKDGYDVAVFSKIPFKEVNKLHPFSRGCIVVNLETELGEISIAGLHLDYRSESLRIPEIEIVLNFLKQFPKSILMGDFNSLSPKDNYYPSIIEHFTPRQIEKFTKDGKFCFDVITKIESAKFEDVAVKFNKNKEDTVPTPMNRDTDHGKMRLDYIFVSDSLLSHVKSYEVIKNKITDKASDHYPVTITLE